MNLENFQQILVALTSPNNVERSEAENVITNFMQNNYFDYLELLVIFMSNSDSALIRKQCVTYLFTAARRDSLFLTPEVFNFLWPKLKENYVNFLLSNVCSPEVKNIFCSIISIMASFDWKMTQSTEIQNFLMQSLELNPILAQYVASTLTELFMASKSLCGISMTNVLTIISLDISDVTNVALFFSIASIAPEEGMLHQAFEQIIVAIQPESLSDFLKSLMNFAESTASFFAPHLQNLTQYLMNIAYNKKLGMERNYAMMSMASIAKGASKMCKAAKNEFLFPATSCLIHVISEITDDANWVFDPNDTAPYTIAKESFSTISRACGNNSFFAFLAALVNEELSKPNQPWQNVYACVSALAELDTKALSSLLTPIMRNTESKDIPIIRISIQIMSFIQDLNCHPRIRLSAYDFINQLCRWIGPYFQRIAGYYVLPLLKQLIFRETHPLTRKAVISCLTSYFSTISIDQVENFDSTFQELISMVDSSSDDIKPYIVKCLGVFARAGKNEFVKFFPMMANKMQSLILQPNLNLKMSAIEAFSISCLKIIVPDMHKGYCMDFLSSIIQLLDHSKENNLNDRQIDSIKFYACVLIRCLGPNFKPFANKIVPDALMTANQIIEVTSVSPMDFTNEGYSFQMQIPSAVVSGAKQFVYIVDVQSICKALDIITTSANALQKDFIEYMEQSIQIVQHWLSSDYHIEPIKIKCCNILYICMAVAMKNGAMPEILTIVVDLYLKNVNPTCSQKLLNSLLLMIQRAIYLRINGNAIDNERIVHILETIPPLIQLTLQRKSQLISLQKRYQQANNPEFDNFLVNSEGDPIINAETVANAQEMEEDQQEVGDNEIEKQNEILATINDLIKLCFQTAPLISIPFFQQNMMDTFIEYMNNKESLTFAILVWSEYLIVSKDKNAIQQFLPSIFDLAAQQDLEFSPLAFEIIGNLFSKIQFDNETLESCYRFFHEEMNKQYIVGKEFSSIADCALVALTKVIMHSPQLMQNQEVLGFWLEMFPIWEPSDQADLVYGFLATLLEEKNPNIFNSQHFDRIINLISTYAFSDFMKIETSIRFSRFIKEMVSNPNYAQLTQNCFNSLDPKCQNCFIALVNFNE